MTSPLDGSPAGRLAIVTGGSRGIGRAVVATLAGCGYAVIVNYVHDQRAAESTVEAVLAGNGAAVAIRADVADELDVQRLFAETIELFGGVDVVVHAVGVRVGATPVSEVDLDDFDAICRLNSRAAFIVNREAARRVRAGGAIVNLSSSVVGSPLPGYGALAATRAGTEALTRTLALELRDRHITVNAVSVEADRPCVPGRVADLVVSLLGAERHGLTGRILRLDDPVSAARACGIRR